MSNIIPFVLIVILILGWQTARFHRARKDLAAAKDGVKAARRVLGVERVPFLIITAITVLILWWWLKAHGA
jgi:hypothetical protein